MGAKLFIAPLNSKQSCPKDKFGIGYVKKNGFNCNPLHMYASQNRGRPTISIVTWVPLIIEYLTWYQIKN